MKAGKFNEFVKFLEETDSKKDYSKRLKAECGFGLKRFDDAGVRLGFNDCYDYIKSAFAWGNTAQGRDYWASMARAWEMRCDEMKAAEGSVSKMQFIPVSN